MGHILTPEGITQDPDKVEKIRNFKRPRNQKQLQSFLGFLNFHAKIVDKYAETIHPLLDLNKKRNASGIPCI